MKSVNPASTARASLAKKLGKQIARVATDFTPKPSPAEKAQANSSKSEAGEARFNPKAIAQKALTRPSTTVNQQASNSADAVAKATEEPTKNVSARNTASQAAAEAAWNQFKVESSKEKRGLEDQKEKFAKNNLPSDDSDYGSDLLDEDIA